jgi:predicted metalloprotease
MHIMNRTAAHALAVLGVVIATGFGAGTDQGSSVVPASTSVAVSPGAALDPQSPELIIPAAEAATLHELMIFVVEDADAFWTGVWEEAGRPAQDVQYAFPAAGEAQRTSCTASGFTDDSNAFYCTVDDQIVLSQVVAAQILEGTYRANADGVRLYATGDFSVAYIVAHEYAHSLQAELGILQPYSLVHPVYKTELHADCWAGVWAKSAFNQGILDAGDIEEAVQTTLDIGDFEYDNLNHHGTPDQRSAALMRGYDSGIPEDCESYLSGDY